MNALQGRYAVGSTEHEQAISEEVTRRRVEAFGEEEVIVDKTDERYLAIEAYIKEVTQDWPKAPISKSRFVACYCSVFARVVCNIVPGQGDTSLFIDEITKKAYFGPLASKVSGPLTSEDTTLTVQNIQLSEFAVPSEGILCSPDMVVINNKKPIRIGPIKHNVLVAQGSARVTFKGFLDNEFVEVEAEKQKESASIKLIITICELRGKILSDGSITLTEKILSNGTVTPIENGPTFNIHTYTRLEKFTWVGIPYGLNVPFSGFEG